MLDIFIPFFSFSSSSELILGILHLLLRPTSVSFNLLLVSLSGGVIRLARSVHRSWLLPSEPTATKGQTLSPEGPTRQPAMSWLLTSTGITSPVRLLTTSLMAANWGAAEATAKKEHTWMRANMSNTLCCLSGSPH